MDIRPSLLLAVLLALPSWSAGQDEAPVPPGMGPMPDRTDSSQPTRTAPEPGQEFHFPDAVDPLERRRQLLERLRQRNPAGQPGFPQAPGLPPSQRPGMSRPGVRVDDPFAGLVAEGRKLTLDLRGLDIQEALKILARESGINIVAGANVRGKVTLYLKGVDLREALDALLESNQLAGVRKGDVVQILSAPEYEKLYGVQLAAPRRVEAVRLRHMRPESARTLLLALKTKDGDILLSSEGLVLVDTADGIAAMRKALEILDVDVPSRVFAVNYAKVEDILAKIPPSTDPAEGSVQADLRTNRLLVTGSQSRIDEVARIVSAFDAPHREVIIEAKIVQVVLDDNHQFGVNWSNVFDRIGAEKVAGKVVGMLQMLPAGTQGAADAATKGITATIGSIAQNKFTAALSLIETVGKTNLLSSPRISAINGQEASILVGTREAYVTTTVVTPGAGGATTTSEQVNFVDVGVKLFVTPMIGEDGFVTLKIKPEVSSVNSTITTSQGNTIPIVRTSQAETSVMVQDGTTIVIGGLIEDRKEEQVNRVPILGRIPLLGAFFRSKATALRKTELAIFLTPTLLKFAEAGKEAATP